MRLNIKSIITGATLLMATSAVAQNTEAGYFLEDFTYRYQSNPAFANRKGFFAMPTLGNMNFGMAGNLGVNDVLYNVNGRTTTFLNPNVSTAEAMDRLGKDKNTSFYLRETILGIGFKGIKGYNTITISARADVGLKVPGALFSLLKEGISNETYQIDNIRARATAFTEVALGHSHQLTSDIRIGVTLKALVGAGFADVNMKQARLALGQDNWTVTSEGESNIHLKGFNYETEVNENTGHTYVNGGDYKVDGISGIGGALDLGVIWRPHTSISVLNDFEFSAAILDLGFINWNNNMYATTGGVKTFNLNKYTFNVDDNATNSFDNEWQKIEDDFSAIYEMEDKGDIGSKTRMLGATVNVGALYTLRSYSKLKFGLLNTSYIAGDFSWNDTRVSANWMPSNIFDMSVNAHTGTYGTGFGGILNLHCTGFNFVIAFDDIPTKLSKDGIPLTSNTNFNFGINFLF